MLHTRVKSSTNRPFFRQFQANNKEISTQSISGLLCGFRCKRGSNGVIMLSNGTHGHLTNLLMSWLHLAAMWFLMEIFWFSLCNDGVSYVVYWHPAIVWSQNYKSVVWGDPFQNKLHMVIQYVDNDKTMGKLQGLVLIKKHCYDYEPHVVNSMVV